MLDFTYYTPTKIFFGKDSHLKLSEIVTDYGYKKVMLVYGMGSVLKSGLLDTVTNSLTQSGIEFILMGGVKPNPTLAFVNRAITVARQQHPDLILAVGGGSALDTAKYIATGTFYDGDVWDFPSKKATPKAALDVACILTISAAGSEMSSSAVITNEALNEKRGYNSDFNRCRFAILNPKLTYTVSPYQTACGIVDIMAHTMERYFVPCNDTPLTDRIAEGILKSVVKAGRVVIKNPTDYEARAQIMWASSLSHNDLTGCGRQNALAVHQLEHALSGEYTFIAHGAGLAVLFPAWARYVYKYNPARFARFARKVFDVTEQNNEKAALLGIEKMEEFFSFIGMPLKTREFGINKDSAARLAELCTFNKQRVIGSYIDLDYNDIKNIFDSCY